MRVDLKSERGQSDLGFVFGAFAIVALIGGVIIALMFLLPAYNRGQRLKNAHNEVKVTAIQIQNQEQRVKIAKQKAEIRFQNSLGIRRAQDEIAKTLTPAYLQWEAIQAQLALAGSKNSTFIYIPSGANGVPLVATTPQLQTTTGGK